MEPCPYCGASVVFCASSAVRARSQGRGRDATETKGESVMTEMNTAIEDNYDLRAACGENGIDSSDIEAVLLEITGENDERDWHWIVKTKAGFAYITGGCDYTGWDCRSSADRHDAETLEGALALTPQDERRIFEEMSQKGEIVRAAIK